MFEQLVLNKANELVDEGKFDEAYDYFTFLQRNKPATPGLAKAGEDFLFAEANAAYHKGQYDSALALLRELYRRNPKRPGLDRVLGGTTDKLVEQYCPRRIIPRRECSCTTWLPSSPTTRWSPSGTNNGGARPPRCWPRPARRPSPASGARPPS